MADSAPRPPRLRALAGAAWTVALLAALDLVAIAPRLYWKNETPGFRMTSVPSRSLGPGLGYELGILVALVALAAGTRAARAVRIAAVVLFAAFLIFSAYHEAYLNTFFVDPAVVEDVRLVPSLFHLVHSLGRRGWLTVGASVAAYAASIALAAVALRRVTRAAASWSRRARLAALAAWVVVGGLAVALPQRRAVVQPLFDGVVVNLRASFAALAARRAIFDAEPDRRLDALRTWPMARRPNLYLVFFEAYGETLATCASGAAYDALLARMESRLAAAGWQTRSAWSEAPVYGGRSWMVMGTLQSGVRIALPTAFAVLEPNAARLPTLTNVLRQHGYHTLMLQPWDQPRFGLPYADTYRRDRTLVRADLPYHGPPTGVAGVPDQFSLGYADAEVITKAPQPRFLSYIAITTHYPWFPPTPPFVADWRTLDGPTWPPAAPWEPLAGEGAIREPILASYFSTVVYEWRTLADFIERRKDEDALIVLLGDHQPFVPCKGGGQSYRTPLHVLARDPALLARFDEAGLRRGLRVPVGEGPPLKHEGLYSLIFSALATAGGGPAPPLYPDGVSPSALRAVGEPLGPAPPPMPTPQH